MIVKQLITRLGFKNDESGYRKYKNTQNKAKRDSERFVRSIKSDHIGLHKRVIHGHVNMIRKMVGGMRSYKSNASRTYDSLVSKARASFAKIAASQAKANAKSSMGGMSSGKAIMGIGGAYAAYSGVSKLTSELINAGTNLESNMARLEVVMGNKSAAKQIFDKMAVFAEKTPFKMNELLSGFASIKGSGYEMTDEDLTGLGNLASGSKKSMGEMFEMLKSANRGLGAMVDNFDGLRASAAGGMLEVSRFNKETQKWESQSFKQGDMGGILKYVAAHGNKSFAGSMQKQSQTFGGKMSTLFDRIEGRFRDLWQGGADKFFHMLLNYALDLSSKMKPFVESIIPKLIKGMGLLKKYLPAIAGTLGFFLARFAGLKLILAGGWLLKMVSAFRSLTLLSLGAFALPAAITAAVVAVGYLGYEIYKFATTGKGLIKNLSDKFPAFGKAVEGLKKAMIDLWVEVKPYALEFWELMKQLGEWIYTEGAKAFKWLYKEAIIPMIIEGIKWLTQFIKDWVDGFKTIIQWGKDWHSGFKTIMNWFTKVMGDVSAGFSDWKTNLENTFNYIRDQFPWVSKLVSGVAKLFGYGGGSGGGSGGQKNTSTFTGKTFSMKDTSGRVHQLPAWMARVIKPGDREALDTDAFFNSWRDGGKRMHRSFDFHGKVNAPVFAAMGGTIIKSASEKVAGWLADVWVKQDDGKIMRYLHVDPLKFKKGQRVETGDQVGRIIKLPKKYGRSHAHLAMFNPGYAGRVNPQTYNMEQHNHFHGPADPNVVGKKVADKTKEVLHKTANSAPKRSNGLAYTQ